jgi:hypothetical protein
MKRVLPLIDADNTDQKRRDREHPSVGVTHDATTSKRNPTDPGCRLSKKRVVEWTKIPS